MRTNRPIGPHDRFHRLASGVVVGEGGGLKVGGHGENLLWLPYYPYPNVCQLDSKESFGGFVEFQGVIRVANPTELFPNFFVAVASFRAMVSAARRGLARGRPPRRPHRRGRGRGGGGEGGGGRKERDEAASGGSEPSGLFFLFLLLFKASRGEKFSSSLVGAMN